MRGIPVLAACLALIAGCGGGSTQTTRTARPETFDRRPPLPDGWRRVVNVSGGFSFGLPPGWRATSRGGTTLVRSGDGALSASIVADRSDEGRATGGLPGYAGTTIRALSGYRGLRARRPVTLRHARYPTVTVRASGTYVQTGVRQDILLAAIRRPGQVTYSLLFFRNARTDASLYAPAVRGIIRSLRGRPPRF